MSSFLLQYLLIDNILPFLSHCLTGCTISGKLVMVLIVCQDVKHYFALCFVQRFVSFLKATLTFLCLSFLTKSILILNYDSTLLSIYKYGFCILMKLQLIYSFNNIGWLKFFLVFV